MRRTSRTTFSGFSSNTISPVESMLQLIITAGLWGRGPGLWQTLATVPGRFG